MTAINITEHLHRSPLISADMLRSTLGVRLVFTRSMTSQNVDHTAQATGPGTLPLIYVMLKIRNYGFTDDSPAYIVEFRLLIPIARRSTT